MWILSEDGDEELFTKPWFGTFNMLFATRRDVFISTFR